MRSSRHEQMSFMGLINAVTASLPWTEMQTSRRPHIFLPSTHLHNSVDVPTLARAGVNGPTSRVQVADASVLGDVGPGHHSFKLMVAAFKQAHQLTQSL
jgi:hypothetical protein